MSRKDFLPVILSAILVIGLAVGAEAADPQVTNVRATQLADGRVEVLYDLSGAPSDGGTVSIAFSDTGGSPYNIRPQGSTLSGHFGAGVTNGSNRRIVWDVSATLPSGTYGTSYRAAVTAVEPAGQTGDISFRLQWTGSHDLDLHVKEPSGEEIYFGHPVSATGGQLDVDANYPCDNQSPNPTENIFWPEGQAPSGTYTYWVELYATCQKSSVSYTIDVLVGTEIVETQTGTLTQVGESSPESTQSYSGGGGDDTIIITLEGGVTMELVHIPAGTFMMGSPTNERARKSDEDLHQVTLTRGYYMGKYEVTQAQWQAVMGSNPSRDYGVGDDYPVYFVSWDDICGGSTGADCTSSSFIGRLNAQLGTTTFRLPTEAEWERAARAGTQTTFSFGDDISCSLTDCSFCPLFDQYMWWCGNDNDRAEEVGSKPPNVFGLYGMHGNVMEWVADWWTASLGTIAVTDPAGPGSGSYRVRRGGSYTAYAGYGRSARRNYWPPHQRGSSLGFRLARSE